MSKTYKDSRSSKAARRGRQRNISVRAVHRDPPDLRKLSRALIQLALAQAEADAQAATTTTGRAAVSPNDEAMDD
jgi:hypothetical protein